MGKYWELMKLYLMVRRAKTLKGLFGSSAFWMSIVTIVGSMLTSIHVIPQDTWDKLFVPLLVYVIGRITSASVKAMTGTTAVTKNDLNK